MPEPHLASMVMELSRDDKTDAGSMESSAITQPASQGLTRPATIKLGQAKQQNLWIFEYRLRDTNGLYVIRCPRESCGSPVFSCHPLVRGRAAKHLGDCGLEFLNEEDMMRRYARLGKYPQTTPLQISSR
jgi:hypothetical protein